MVFYSRVINMLNHREQELLDFFVKNKKSTYEEICNKYSISERAARYNIDNINYFLEVLHIIPIKKSGKELYFDNTQDISNIYTILNDIEVFSQEERLEILKFILCFDKTGLNLTKSSEKLRVSRTTIKKDMKILKKEMIQEDFDVTYKNNEGYRLEGEPYKLELYKIGLLKGILILVNTKDKESSYKKTMSELCDGLFNIKDKESIKEFILNIHKNLSLNISDEIFYVIYAYLIILTDDHKNIQSLYTRSSNKSFLLGTKEFLVIEKEIKKIKELKNTEIPKERILELADFILGITTNEYSSNNLENWIHEEVFIKKMVNEFNKYIELDITSDEILIDCLIYHMKPVIYRIRNNIRVTNPVFKELIISKDPILEIVRIITRDIEKMFGIEFPEEELALLAFHFKASKDRNTHQNLKRILLVCGLGYGSSRLLEQSIKEHYNVDIVDVLPYYLLKDALKNYKNIDLILTTLDITEKYKIPVVKINPLLKQEDYLEMAKYNIPKNDNKIFLSKILKIIKKNTKIINEEILINEIKQEFKNRIIDDVDYKTTHIKEFINEKSVVVLDEVESWEEAIKISGNLLVDNMYVKTEYIDEMINLVKKYGSYIVIDDGIALPHAGISRNVLKLGVGVLVVKKPVLFSDKKSANIFISFASNENKSHLTILNDLFDLITKYDLKGELLQAKDKQEVIDYFIKTKV
jgi:transcriptional antiterminator/mannitol/fructose-specific phosphotransferase system IIA component (Ntr-type)